MNVNNTYINEDWAKKFTSAKEMQEALPHLPEAVVTEAFNIINHENTAILTSDTEVGYEEGGKQLNPEKPKTNKRSAGGTARTGSQA